MKRYAIRILTDTNEIKTDIVIYTDFKFDCRVLYGQKEGMFYDV